MQHNAVTPPAMLRSMIMSDRREELFINMRHNDKHEYLECVSRTGFHTATVQSFVDYFPEANE